MYVILVIITIFNAMIFLDQTVLPVALSTIQQQFHCSSIALNWMLDGYFLSLAAFMLAGGRLADIFGLKRIFALGMVVFTVASLFCGLSNDSTTLIISRIVQGIGGSLMIPPSMPILLSAFPEHKKVSALGWVVALSSVFMILGPIIGGFFCQYFNWRYIFWINLPISLIGLILTYFFIPKSPANKQHFDILGFAIKGVNSLGAIFMLCLGLMFFYLLYLKDRKAHDPFIKFSLFKNRVFSSLGLNIFATAFVLTITVFLPMYMQKVFAFLPFQTGYYTMLSSIPIMFASPIAGKISDIYGVKKVTIPSQVTLLFSYLLIALLLPLNNFWLIFPWLFVLSIGLPSIFTCSFAVGINAIDPKNRGQASGLLGTIRSLGVNFGVAIVSSSMLGLEKLFSYTVAFAFVNYLYVLIIAISIWGMFFIFRDKK
jgi:EmrB/QacA subfamily drug resistance transporter